MMLNHTPLDLTPSPKKLSPQVSLLIGVGLIVASVFMVGSSYFLAQSTDSRSRAASLTNAALNPENGQTGKNDGSIPNPQVPNPRICPAGSVSYDPSTQICENPIIIGIAEGSKNTSSTIVGGQDSQLFCCSKPLAKPSNTPIPKNLSCNEPCGDMAEGQSCGEGRVCTNVACLQSGSSPVCDAIDIRCVNPTCPTADKCSCDAPPTNTPTLPPSPLKCGEECVEGQNNCEKGLKCANTLCAPGSNCDGSVFKCVKETCQDPSKCRCDCVDPSFEVTGKNDCVDCDG